MEEISFEAMDEESFEGMEEESFEGSEEESLEGSEEEALGGGKDEAFEGWTSWLEDAYLLCTPDDPECLKHPYITRTEADEPQYTIEQEIDMMNEQIEASEGFDIDYTLFRCLFNYHPVNLDGKNFVEEPETNRDFLNRLTQESLNRYNEEEDTNFEFLEVEKANFHWCCGYMFLITFQVLDPSDDNQPKDFQTRIRYSSHYPPEYVFCRPKPVPKVESDNSSEDVKVESDNSSEEDLKAN